MVGNSIAIGLLRAGAVLGWFPGNGEESLALALALALATMVAAAAAALAAIMAVVMMTY